MPFKQLSTAWTAKVQFSASVCCSPVQELLQSLTLVLFGRHGDHLLQFITGVQKSAEKMPEPPELPLLFEQPLVRIVQFDEQLREPLS